MDTTLSGDTATSHARSLKRPAVAKKLRKRGDTHGGASFEGDDDVTQVVTGVAKHGRTRENRDG